MQFLFANNYWNKQNQETYPSDLYFTFNGLLKYFNFMV